MIIWNKNIYKNCFKHLNKGLKLEIKKYHAILLQDINRNSKHKVPEDDEELELDQEKKDIEEFIIMVRNCLIDLSLNYHSVNYLEHSNFFKLSGGTRDDTDEQQELESEHKRIFDFKDTINTKNQIDEQMI